MGLAQGAHLVQPARTSRRRATHVPKHAGTPARACRATIEVRRHDSWCIGLESGAASGWPGSDWVKEIVLSQSGPDRLRQLVAGQARSGPRLRSSSAWQTWGQILGAEQRQRLRRQEHDPATNFGDAGTPMFADPTQVLHANQASFITELLHQRRPEPQGRDGLQLLRRFPTSRAVRRRPRRGRGRVVDVPATPPRPARCSQYLTTAEAQTIWVKRGGKISPNKKSQSLRLPGRALEADRPDHSSTPRSPSTTPAT